MDHPFPENSRPLPRLTSICYIAGRGHLGDPRGINLKTAEESHAVGTELKKVKIGLILVLLGLAFGVILGISFGVFEDNYKAYISSGMAAHPGANEPGATREIWRFVQRAHFHATGIAAFSLGLILFVMFSDMKSGMKTVSSVLIGLSSFYPLSWFTMFLKAPSMGAEPSHEYFLTVIFAVIGIGGLALGASMLAGNLVLGMFREESG
jgi:hypothetical protein